MVTTELSYLRNELEIRRQRLLEASSAQAADASLRQLLASVDAALSRLDTEDACRAAGVAGTGHFGLQLLEGEFSEFEGALEVTPLTLVIDGQLFAGL